MKRHAFWGVLVVLGLLVPLALFLLSCGSGGGSGTSGTSDSSGGSATSGTLSISVTDAKPELPDGVTKVLFTFGEVRVHTPGGGWKTLPLANGQPEYTIDLLQFSKPEHETAQLVPPVRLDPGKYTQLRFPVISASIKFDTDGDGVDDKTEPLEVPSEELKIDPEFTFEVPGGGAVNLTVDFVLSRNIVVTGNPNNQKFILKPVLHIVETEQAATIRGSIPAVAFGSMTTATVTVWSDKDDNCILDKTVDEIYTTVEVPKADPVASSSFEIFWLVPYEAYFVQIDVGGNMFFFTVPGPPGSGCQKVQPGVIYGLGLATIQGSIAPATFGGSTEAKVTVLVDPDGDGLSDLSDDKEYTEVTVTKASNTEPTAFSVSVFPTQDYVVQVETNGAPPPEYQEAIPANQLPAGTTFNLHDGNPI